MRRSGSLEGRWFLIPGSCSLRVRVSLHWTSNCSRWFPPPACGLCGWSSGHCSSIAGGTSHGSVWHQRMSVCVSGWMLTLRCKVLWVVGKTRKVLCNGPCSPFTFSKLWKMKCLRAKEVRNLCCIVFSPTQHKDEVAFAQEKQLICIPNEPREIQLSCPLCLSCCYFPHSMNLNPGPTALCSNKLTTEGDREQQWALSWHSGVVHAGHSASFLLSLLDGVK